MALIGTAISVLVPEVDPSTPDAGRILIYPVGNRLVTKDSSGDIREYADISELSVVAPFFHTGDLETGTGKFRFYNDTGRTLTIKSVRAYADTAPTGAGVILDVNLSGTTIYTTQMNRPTISAGSNVTKNVDMDVTAWPDGDYLTVDIDQVGSTIAGANLSVQVTAV